MSAEKELNAARTLRLRAFFRMFAKGHVPRSFYDYVAGRRAEPWTSRTESEWREAGEQALQLELGVPADDIELGERIKRVVPMDEPWVLIGGPPCQAYSLVGRARNKGVLGYLAEEDKRHFLYRHYLRIIRRYRPAAFVMENVPGILSSRVDGSLIFPKILDDLRGAGGNKGVKYQIIPLLANGAQLLNDYSPKDFVVRAEEFGVPQARHRIVLLGIAEGIKLISANMMTPRAVHTAVDTVIGCLPPLRSGITDGCNDDWRSAASAILSDAARAAARCQPEVAKSLSLLAVKAKGRRYDPGRGGRWQPKTVRSDDVAPHLTKWLLDKRLDGILNHEVRSHMTSDLVRYAYAAAFAAIYDRSPRGPAEFPEDLYPCHRSWGSGKFVDRFKVQLSEHPSSTITSHLSKDGHYYIHPDPSQFRSLSVREAARLQTFPDNYFFEGSKGAQYRQVGNAVPPWLALQIAGAVYGVLNGS